MRMKIDKITANIRSSAVLFLLSMYLLGSHRGYLALWKEDSEDPFQIFPRTVDTLPPEEQEALEKGIRIRSDLELAQYLENYLS